MAYLSNFTHDVFVSYAHGPKPFGRRTDLLSTWTKSFIDDLSSQLDLLLGAKDQKRRVSVWMDEALDGNRSLSNGLNSNIKESALLLVVMSKLYLESAWCGTELRWFTDEAGKAPTDRIFVVKAYNTQVDQWPAALKPDGHPVPGYAFYSAEYPDDLGTPLGYPQPDMSDKDYWLRLRKLANQMASQLKRIEWIASSGDVSAKKIESVPARVGRTLFLGYMHDTLSDVRSGLRDRLDRTGFKVVPPADDDPVDEATLRDAFAKYISAADAIVLVGNENCELWPKGQKGGALGLQLQMAQQSSKPVHLWLQPSDLGTVKNEQYRSFLATLEANARTNPGILIHAQDIDEYVRHVSAKLDMAPKAGKGAEQLAVVRSNIRPDEAEQKKFRDIVVGALAEAERSSVIADEDDPSGQIRLTALQDEISHADTVVVICFDQEWIWANNFIRQLRQLMSEHTVKTRMVVVGPKHQNKGTFRAPFNFQTVEGVTANNAVHGDLADRIKRVLSGAA